MKLSAETVLCIVAVINGLLTFAVYRLVIGDAVMDYYANLGYNEVQARALINLGDNPPIVIWSSVVALGTFFGLCFIEYAALYWWDRRGRR